MKIEELFGAAFRAKFQQSKPIARGPKKPRQSKYQPHQGVRECERRVKQMQRSK